VENALGRTFAEARDEADHLDSAFAAKTKGLTVAEFDFLKFDERPAIQQFRVRGDEVFQPVDFGCRHLDNNAFGNRQRTPRDTRSIR
jgi:hypothetical protein